MTVLFEVFIHFPVKVYVENTVMKRFMTVFHDGLGTSLANGASVSGPGHSYATNVGQMHERYLGHCRLPVGAAFVPGTPQRLGPCLSTNRR
jgi:hypothetical protein